MIENLLHANIVLSKKNVATLKAKGVANIPSLIGIITFLGSADGEGKMVNLLFRFNSVGFDTLRSIHMVEEVLQQRTVALYGNESVNSTPRLMATAIVDKKLKNPRAYLYAIGKKVADTCTSHILLSRDSGSSAYW